MTKQRVKVKNEPSPLTLKILEHEDFGNVRVIYEDGKYLFCALDVATALGYAKPRNAITMHCRYALKRGVPQSTVTRQNN